MVNNYEHDLQPAILWRACKGAPERCAEVPPIRREGEAGACSRGRQGFLMGCGLEMVLRGSVLSGFGNDALVSGARANLEPRRCGAEEARGDIRGHARGVAKAPPS